MTDEEFEKELNQFAGMLRNLRLIKDKSHRRIFKSKLRALLTFLMSD